MTETVAQPDPANPVRSLNLRRLLDWKLHVRVAPIHRRERIDPKGNSQGRHGHFEVLKDAWQEENERKKISRKSLDPNFLPAALEVLEKPPSPIGRILLWVILSFFTIALLWAAIGRLDVVASAQGRLLPDQRVKTIQPAETGVVRTIHVRDGQSVRAGEILVELDPTFSGAEAEQARRALLMARIDQARANALLNFQDGELGDFVAPPGASEGAILTQKRLIESQRQEHKAQLASFQQQKAERIADLAVVEKELSKLSKTLPLLEEQLAAREKLLEKGLTPRLLVLELQERVINHRENVEIQHSQKTKMIAAIQTTERQIEQLTEEFKKNVIADLAEAENHIELQEQELKKAAQRNELQRLTAPVDGVVQQLQIHTIGGVVQAAQPLMVVVPGDGDLIVEARVLNKDIGFVNVGDEVQVKLDAFPFTKYGAVPGTLEDLSMDAVQDEALGLVYVGRVALERQHISVKGQSVKLAPGMVATVEVKTGTRRVIEYLLSPLLRYRDESLRER